VVITARCIAQSEGQGQNVKEHGAAGRGQ
jgi:hypothetical protein